MKKITLIVIFCLSLLTNLSAQITQRVGTEIDKNEKEYFCLFPNTDNFQSANFIVEADSSFYFEIYYSDSTGNKSEKLEISYSSLLILNQYIEEYEKICIHMDLFTYPIDWDMIVPKYVIPVIHFIEPENRFQLVLNNDQFIDAYIVGFDSTRIFLLRSIEGYDWKNFQDSLLCISSSSVRKVFIQDGIFADSLFFHLSKEKNIENPFIKQSSYDKYITNMNSEYNPLTTPELFNLAYESIECIDLPLNASSVDGNSVFNNNNIYFYPAMIQVSVFTGRRELFTKYDIDIDQVQFTYTMGLAYYFDHKDSYSLGFNFDYSKRILEEGFDGISFGFIYSLLLKKSYNKYAKIFTWDKLLSSHTIRFDISLNYSAYDFVKASIWNNKTILTRVSLPSIKATLGLILDNHIYNDFSLGWSFFYTNSNSIGSTNSKSEFIFNDKLDKSDLSFYGFTTGFFAAYHF